MAHSSKIGGNDGGCVGAAGKLTRMTGKRRYKLIDWRLLGLDSDSNYFERSKQQ